MALPDTAVKNGEEGEGEEEGEGVIMLLEA